MKSSFISRPLLGAATAHVVLLSALPLLSGCGTSGSSGPVTSPTANPYASVVFIGDSLTAGFQNGSLLDTQQPNGYPSLIAAQAKFTVALPLIAAPGAPAVLRLVSLGPPPVTASASGTTTGRDSPTTQPTNLAVPGHKLHDVINYAPPLVPTSDEDLITELVLGFPVGNTNAQLAEAVVLKPTTIFAWAGSDDALQADETGMPSSMTSLASFTADFTQMMTTLKGTSANLFIANVPDVTLAPYLTPAATIVAEVAAMSGLPAAAVQAGLGLGSTDLVNAQGLADTETELKGLATGGKLTALPDGDVLTAAEIVTVQNMINSYNQVIQQQVAAAGATLVDMHAYFATLAAGVSINGITANNAYLGGLFSVDGIHPTNTGYALLANQFIAAMNSKFGSSIATVNVSAIAAVDPYFGPNIKPTGKVRIPTAAALRTDDVISGWTKMTQ